MAITSDLIKEITFGDYSRIASIFNKQHLGRAATDSSYVQKVITGKCKSCNGTIAAGIKKIAEVYLPLKAEFNRKLSKEFMKHQLNKEIVEN